MGINNKNKKQGRQVADLSAIEEQFDYMKFNFNKLALPPVNGNLNKRRAMRKAFIEKWGRIRNPTIEKLMGMILHYQDLFPGSDLVLYKLDLSGAYNLLNFAIKDIPLLTFQLTRVICDTHDWTIWLGWYALCL